MSARSRSADLRTISAIVAAQRLNNIAIVVLGVIAAGRRNGYEIAQSVERSTRHFWPANSGGSYPELRRLQDAGLLEARDDPQGDRARHSYELTASDACGRSVITGG